jgi:putative ABC transport system substrate-binding protein
MERRAFISGITLGLLAAPLGVEAQQPGKVYRIGYLVPSSATAVSNVTEAFREGLRELGWVEGQNIVIEYRFAEGRFDRLPDLAAELVRLKMDVIVAYATPTAVAAKNATATIPIVMFGGGDPVGLGLIANLARPGGNVTGLSYSVGMETFGKSLELLKAAVPKVRRVAVLSNPANQAHALAISTLKVAAQSLGLQLQLLEA